MLQEGGEIVRLGLDLVQGPAGYLGFMLRQEDFEGGVEGSAGYTSQIPRGHRRGDGKVTFWAGVRD